MAFQNLSGMMVICMALLCWVAAVNCCLGVHLSSARRHALGCCKGYKAAWGASGAGVQGVAVWGVRVWVLQRVSALGSAALRVLQGVAVWQCLCGTCKDAAARQVPCMYASICAIVALAEFASTGSHQNQNPGQSFQEVLSGSASASASATSGLATWCCAQQARAAGCCTPILDQHLAWL